MDEANPRAEAVDFNTTMVLMPGVIYAHNHPGLSGMGTQEPSSWIAPYLGYPTYANVQSRWKKLDSELPPGQLGPGGIDGRLAHALLHVRERRSVRSGEQLTGVPQVMDVSMTITSDLIHGSFYANLRPLEVHIAPT